MAEKFVAYYRVSTQKQGKSGLGLEAQRTAVESFLGGRGEVIANFVEVETGKKNDRQKLSQAIETAKATGAKLVIAKLDRLSRNASFILALRDSGVDFQACDLPDANTLTIGIFASLAQHERELISKRTKDALAAKKARGFRLGKPENLTEESRRRAQAVRKQTAKENEINRKALAIAQDLREQGLSLNKIASKLNSYGFTGASGGRYYAVTISKLFRLFER